MNTKTLVDRGLELRLAIETLESELAEIERSLAALAQRGEHVPLEDEDREGKQFLARGSRAVVPVVFTADKIIASFKDRSDMHAMIVRALPNRPLDPFYRAETTWKMSPKDGKAFRKVASEVLGPAGPGFVTACLARDKHGIPKSDIKIEWERARELSNAN